MGDAVRQGGGVSTDTSPRGGSQWVVARSGAHGYRTEVTVRDHAFVADEPGSEGGADEGPTPYELLLAAIASCTAMTLRMYADRKQWPLHGATVQVRTASVHASDCSQCETTAVGIRRLEHRIVLDGPLSDDQRERMLEIAERCPVRQTLLRGIAVDSVV